jgi:hypothetical protein
MEQVYRVYCLLHRLKFGEPAVEVPEFTQPRSNGLTFTIAEGADGEEDEKQSENASGSSAASQKDGSGSSSSANG